MTSHAAVPGHIVTKDLDQVRASARDIPEVKAQLRREGALRGAHAVIHVKISIELATPQPVVGSGVAVHLKQCED